jgi:hypothetical protein
MEVPFISSGALSAAHYALVSAVEAAPSPATAEDHLHAALAAQRARLTQPGLSTVRRRLHTRPPP